MTGPKPGAFPLGSEKSRAAARAMLDRIESKKSEERPRVVRGVDKNRRVVQTLVLYPGRGKDWSPAN